MVSKVSFHGHTLFKEPKTKPPKSASVRLRWVLNIQSSTREKLKIPTKQPPANRLIKPNWNSFIASMTCPYMPNSSKIKAPEIPGSIMAQIASIPAKKKYSGLGSKAVGDSAVKK